MISVPQKRIQDKGLTGESSLQKIPYYPREVILALPLFLKKEGESFFVSA